MIQRFEFSTPLNDSSLYCRNIVSARQASLAVTNNPGIILPNAIMEYVHKVQRFYGVYILGTNCLYSVRVFFASTWTYASVPLVMTESCYSVLPSAYSYINR